MLTIKTLKFSGIGRFVEEQTVNFDTLGNLVQVDGQNNNTNGSSGAGKSTVFNALEYLFGLNDIPNTVLQSRLTKEGISVSGSFDLDGQPVTISRTKGKLSVEIGGEVITGSSKLSEEKLDQILSMPRHLFRPMLHKRQKEGGFFLQFTPKEIHEFLTDCLGLSDLRVKAEIIEKKIKELADRKAITDLKLAEAQASLKGLGDALLALGAAPVKEIDESSLLALKNKADASKAVLEALLKQHAEQTALLEKERPVLAPPAAIPSPILDTSEYDTSLMKQASKEKEELAFEIQLRVQAESTRVSEVNRKIQENKLALSTLGHKVTMATLAKNEAVRLAAEVKKIRDAICPTCEQSWVTETAKVKEAELMGKILGHKAQMDEGANAERTIAEVNAQIEALTLQAQPQPIENLEEKKQKIQALLSTIAQEEQNLGIFNTNKRNKNSLLMQQHSDAQKASMSAFTAEQGRLSNEFLGKQHALSNVQFGQASQARGQADLDARLLDAAVSKFRAFEEAKNRYENSLKMLKTQEGSYTAAIAENSDKLAKIQSELLMTEEIKRALKSYASCSFDEALDSISDMATKILRNIPTMANATVQLEGTKETKDGKIKEEVNAVISVDGEIGVPLKSFSGGEMSSIDLAIDLAVVDMIESKTGKGINIFILDEPFTGLDTVGIEMALEILRSANINKKLIVVDHNPEVKEMVESKLLVVRDGDTSKIVQN